MRGWNGWVRWDVVIDEIIIGQFPKSVDDGLDIIDGAYVGFCFPRKEVESKLVVRVDNGVCVNCR